MKVNKNTSNRTTNKWEDVISGCVTAQTCVTEELSALRCGAWNLLGTENQKRTAVLRPVAPPFPPFLFCPLTGLLRLFSTDAAGTGSSNQPIQWSCCSPSPFRRPRCYQFGGSTRWEPVEGGKWQAAFCVLTPFFGERDWGCHSKVFTPGLPGE